MDIRTIEHLQIEPALQQSLGFDPDEEVVDSDLWTTEEINEGVALMAESLGVEELPGGVTIERFHVGGGEIGTLVGGPVTELEMIRDVIEGIAEPENSLESSPQESRLANSVTPEKTALVPVDGMPTPSVFDNTSPLPQAATCGINASGQGTLHGNWGGCTTYSRSVGGTTNWNITDTMAYASNVTVVAGAVDWVLQRRNCSWCTWYVVYSKSVAQGQTYYYWTANTTNDFHASSIVTQTTSGSHNHDVGRCHDWNARTNFLASSLAGGCQLKAFSTSLYCQTSMSYISLDPSNIATSSYYDGSGTPFTCS